MTNKTYTSNEHFLRRAFDTFYTLKAEDLQQGFARVMHRMGTERLALLLISAGALLLLVIAWTLASALITTLTRPTAEQRLAAPYALDNRAPAIVDTTVSALLPSALGDYRLQLLTEADTLLGQCLQSTLNAPSAHCAITVPALYVEVGRYQHPDGATIAIVAAQYATEEAAEQATYEAYQYSRTVGRIGNFAFLDSAPVNYFYSSTRESFSFTWTRGTWVYSIANADLASLEAFIALFPY